MRSTLAGILLLLSACANPEADAAAIGDKACACGKQPSASCEKELQQMVDQYQKDHQFAEEDSTQQQTITQLVRDKIKACGAQ